MKKLVWLYLAACGGKVVAPPPPPEPPKPQRIVLTVVSASLDGRRSDGSAWDDGETVPPPHVRGVVDRWQAAHPELDGTDATIGDPVDVPGVLVSARKSPGPDPLVLVEVGSAVYRTTLAPGQFQPVWRFPLLATAGPEDSVQITVIDWDGPQTFDIMGYTVLPAKTLLAGRTLEVPRFGNVERMLLEVAPAPPMAAHRRVVVAGKDGWVQAGVILTAGQTVTVRAAGEVCTKGSDRTRCSGPEGQPRVSEANVPGFEKKGHGALLGAVGDVRFYLGRERRFVAASSGPLLLGANDVDPDNNSGAYEVAIDAE